MSKAIQGAAMLGGALAMGVATFLDPALAASPMWDKLMASLVMGGISMEAGAIANALSSNRGTGITIRQPAAYRQVIYGERRTGGVLLYPSTTGSHHDQYNAVIVLTAHEVDSITGMYIDGRKVYFQGSGAGWSVRNGVGFGGIADGANHIGPGGQTYNFGGTGHSGLYVEARYGDQSPGDVISGLTANDPNWAADGLGNSPYLGGCCYVYVKLEYNQDLFPGGPASAELKFTVRGKNDIWDPRTGTRGYTSNAALIIADLLTDTNIGLGDIDSVNQDQLVAAANVCEEMVPLLNGSTERRYDAHWNFDSSVAPGDAISNLLNACMGRLVRVGAEWFIFPAYWQGPSFAFEKSDLSGPLEWTPYRKLRELGNRVNGTYIAPNVPYNNAGNLYDSNGWYEGTLLNNFPFGYQPTSFPQYAQDVRHGYASDALLEEDSGVKGPWDSGTLYAEGDAATVSSVIYKSLVDNNLANDPATSSTDGGTYAGLYASGTTYAADALVMYSGQQYRSLVGSNMGNQPDISPTDWQPIVWAKWSNVLPLELDLNCVISVSQAQRLAKIFLLRIRQQGSGTFPLHLAPWSDSMPLDTGTMDFPECGLLGRTVEIASWRFYPEQQQTDGGGSAQALRVEAMLQDTDSSIYDWSTAEELPPQIVSSNPANMPWGLDAPTGLVLSSSSATAILGSDGVNHPRILAVWDISSEDARATAIRVQHRVHGTSTWIDDGTVAPGTGAMYIGGVVAGTVYDVQIRAEGPNGGSSSWVEVDNVTAAAPASLQATYTNSPVIALTQPTATSIALAAVATTFGSRTVNYAARTFTIAAPSTPTWYYVTIADASQVGEGGVATLTPTCSVSNALVGVQGNTYMGAILAQNPPASVVRRTGGGWPAPYTSQVGI